MKTQSRNAALALAGLLALTIYILACASFSPDDTKVLYPAFSGTNGDIGVAVYDRETKRSEMLFVPTVFEGKDEEPPKPQALRAQWLADGRRILVAWAAPEDTLNVALLPWGSRGPFKLFTLPNVKDAGAALLFPVPVSGDQAFFVQSEQERIVRLDLKTGALARHELGNGNTNITLLPVPADKGVFYLEEQSDAARVRVFGRLDPESFALTPLITFTNEPANGSFFAYDPQGRHVAFFEKAPTGDLQLVVLAQGQPAITRPLGAKENELDFGSAVFSPNGDTLLAACQKQQPGQSVGSCELMEIPLGAGPIRETTLIPAVEMAHGLFQIALSHDGKTAAAVSTYLAAEAADDFKPEDCALFLVDLSDAKRKVTKVPIPLPAKRSSAIGK